MSPRLLPARVGVLPARMGVAAVAAVALLVGCTPAGGGGSSASPSASASETPVAVAPPGSPDPCALFTAERLTEIIEIPMAEGEVVPDLSDDGRTICEWKAADPEAIVPRVQVEVNWAFPEVERHREVALVIFPKLKDIEIEGADGAYALRGNRTIGMGVGDYFVKVSYTHPKRKVGNVINETLAAEAVARLTE